MSMKKQPEGVRRVARGERKTNFETGKRLPPDEYDLYLGEAHLGWSERLGKGQWKMHPVAGNVAPEFPDHTAGVEHLLSVHHGLEHPSDEGSAEETEAILADPGTMEAIAEAQAEEPLQDVGGDEWERKILEDAAGPPAPGDASVAGTPVSAESGLPSSDPDGVPFSSAPEGDMPWDYPAPEPSGSAGSTPVNPFGPDDPDADPFPEF